MVIINATWAITGKDYPSKFGRPIQLTGGKVRERETEKQRDPKKCETKEDNEKKPTVSPRGAPTRPRIELVLRTTHFRCLFETFSSLFSPLTTPPPEISLVGFIDAPHSLA